MIHMCSYDLWGYGTVYLTFEGWTLDRVLIVRKGTFNSGNQRNFSGSSRETLKQFGVQ